RTHGTRKGTTVFETVPIDHSGTPPHGVCAPEISIKRGRPVKRRRTITATLLRRKANGRAVPRAKSQGATAGCGRSAGCAPHLASIRTRVALRGETPI